MKKLITILLTGIILLSLGIPAFAAMPDNGEIQPLWDNIKNLTHNLNFNGTSGLASASVIAGSGTTEIKASLAVYKEVGDDQWEYVDHITKRTTSSTSMDLNVSFTGESGAYYKSVLNVTVTKNGVDEQEIKFEYKTCP